MGGFAVSVVESLPANARDAIEQWANSVDAEPVSGYLNVTAHKSAIADVLARIYIIPGLGISASDLKDLPVGVSAFTSQGVCIHSSSDFMIGHHHESSQGVLSRKTEWERLGREVKEVEGELAGLQSQLDTEQFAQQQESAKLRELETKLQSQNQEVLGVLSELQSAKQTLQHKLELKQNAETQRDQLTSYDKKLVEELAEQGQARISLDEDRERIRAELASVSDESGEIEERRSEVFRLHEARKLEHAKYATRAQSIEQGFQQAQTQLQRLQNALTRRYEEQSRIEQQIAAIREEFSQSSAEMEYLLVRRESFRKRID